MKNIFYLLYLILFATLGCKSQEIIKNEIVVIEITNVNYGKISDNFDKVELSKITNIKKENFTSAISGIYLTEKVSYPINDLVFNHDFFNQFEYKEKQKLKLYLQKYQLKNKDILVAIKIE